MATNSSDPGTASKAAPAKDRRSHSRHAIETGVNLILVKTGTILPGQILDLSLSGCRLQLDTRFDLGIFIRIELEFFLNGLPLRLGGVSQTVLDQNTIGIRFLDFSTRRHEQLSELIAELAAAKAITTSAGIS
ncbi:PilZ domain-containing protein [Acidicapsa ligni]|uniref:PilZ domain-containing protein n=1 Tax=Acidicapsa ligni TaxID=542300 RepID=UPI0021E07CD2|nr:PilZ domain-containing protein [Acidicapsa ligni]